MKKLTTILFILIGIVIVFFIIRQNVNFSDMQSSNQFSNFSQPESATRSAEQPTSLIPEADDVTVLVPLLADELFVTALSVDFNTDNYVDQVVAVKDSNSPNIKVIIGLYRPLFGAYERSYILETEIQQTHTFSVDVLDITGTHENSLIISGYSQTNESVLQVWLSEPTASSVNLQLIADLRADGTIFISQDTRSSSYAFSSENADSFPIWVYTSDPESTQSTLDQLHIMYDWDPVTQTYIQQSQTRILGRNINAQELASVQDGTEQSLGTFLSETWLHAASSSDNTLYLSFDYTNKTITFLQNDTAEVYTWESSILRRNGILIYATNTNIPNLLRRVDVTLISLDEIRVKATDTLTLLATPNTTWDGNYHKQEIDSAAFQNASEASVGESSTIIDILKTTSERVWEADNGYTLTFTDFSFSAKNGTTEETGVYTLVTVYGENIIQFKNSLGSDFLNGFYRFEVIEAEEDITRQVVFLPVSVGITSIVPSIAQNITLQQVIR